MTPVRRLRPDKPRDLSVIASIMGCLCATLSQYIGWQFSYFVSWSFGLLGNNGAALLE